MPTRGHVQVMTARRLFPGVRLLPLKGRPLGDSDLIDGVVLDIPLPEPLNAQSVARPMTVALYDISLLAEANGAHALIDSPSTSHSPCRPIRCPSRSRPRPLRGLLRWHFTISRSWLRRTVSRA